MVSLKQQYLALLDDIEGYRERLRTPLPIREYRLNQLRGQIQNAYLAMMAADGLAGGRFVSSAWLPRQASTLPRWYVGSWPEDTPNAHTHAAAGGDLVLLNVGAENAARVMGACGALLTWGEHGSEPATDAAMTLASGHLSGTSAAGIAQELPVPPKHRPTAEALTRYATRYVVCHEYGHIVGGHTGDVSRRAVLHVRRRWSSESAVLWSQRQEFEADEVALRVLRAWEPELARESPAMHATLVTLGPLLMLSAFDLYILTHWSEDRFEVSDGHPPPAARMVMVKEFAQRFATPEVIGSIDTYLRWHDELRQLAGARPMQQR